MLLVQRAIEEGYTLAKRNPMGPFIYDISGGRGNGPSKVDKERDSGMKARTKCRLDWREIGEVHLLNPFEK